MSRSLPETRDYSGLAIAVNALVAIAVTAVVVWWASGFAYNAETLFRVAPTVEAGGIGADWRAGNTIPALDFLIAFIHAADVLMGLGILVMLFVHWGAFRRLASRMRQPGETARYDSDADAVADGGRTAADATAAADGSVDTDGSPGDRGGDGR
ncbi:hypothetical protein [Haloprofundus halophilus]|uniref:hypothetical protein n=1 Tax=Haloprofundus halophilus TaxID=2283527 RepID=UPI0018E51239|nr:hypothetical protein [Haloprofundus halophilus]